MGWEPSIGLELVGGFRPATHAVDQRNGLMALLARYGAVLRPHLEHRAWFGGLAHKPGVGHPSIVTDHVHTYKHDTVDQCYTTGDAASKIDGRVQGLDGKVCVRV